MSKTREINIDMDLVQEAVETALRAQGALRSEEIQEVAAREVNRQLVSGIATIILDIDPKLVRDPRITVISSPRQGGKTNRLIAMMRQNPGAVMAVTSMQQRGAILSRHPDLKDRVYTHLDFLRLSRGRVHPWTEVYVDDAEIFLQRHFGNVRAFTYSEE